MPMYKDFVRCDVVSPCKGFTFLMSYFPVDSIERADRQTHDILKIFSIYVLEHSTVNPNYKVEYGGNTLLYCESPALTLDFSPDSTPTPEERRC